jgi:3-oxoacyl-[acyl-carrier protein] reductase
MDLELSQKVVLVTGSSRGLGFAIARKLGDEGCHVVINGRDGAMLEESHKQIDNGALAFKADVTSADECAWLIQQIEIQFGRLDILVCNVGSGTSVPPGKETPKEWNRVFDLNLKSATNIIAAAEHLLSASRGAVVCISSICGLETLGAPVTYSAAKAALNSYVRGISRPYAAKGIRINAVAPGNLLYEGSVWEQKLTEDPNAVQLMLDREVAQRRLGTPEEIADWVVFLSSPRASFATGETFVVDGGQARS